MQTAKFELDGHSLITPAAISAALANNSKTSPDIPTLAIVQAEVRATLDELAASLAGGTLVAETFDRLIAFLHELRGSTGGAVWAELVPFIQTHHISHLLQQDPATKWSWDKPRGYSGDAHLLDLLYQHPCVSSEVAAASDLGRQLYECTVRAPACFANADRRNILARYADMTAARIGGGAEILSIAAGHVREVDYSDAAKNGHIKRWVALDQDPESIATVAADYGNTCVETVNGSVRDILMNRIDPGLYDHVYSSGLYDYLNEKVAVALTRKALNFVRPGGTFLFANYSRAVTDDGYMETFMNWALLLRSEEDMLEIIRQSTDGLDVESEVFFGENKNVVFGVIRKL